MHIIALPVPAHQQGVPGLVSAKSPLRLNSIGLLVCSLLFTDRTVRFCSTVGHLLGEMPQSRR